jgi:hypothetical protein
MTSPGPDEQVRFDNHDATAKAAVRAALAHAPEE